MTYSELLLSKEWKEKRGTIIKRDGNKCTSCSNQEILKSATLVYFNGHEKNDKIIYANHFDITFEKIIKIKNYKNIELPTNGLLAIKKNNFDTFQILAIRALDNEEKWEYSEKHIYTHKQLCEKYNLSVESVYQSQMEKIIHKKEITDFETRNLDFFIEMRKNQTFNTTLIKLNSNTSESTYYTGLHVHHTYYVHEILPWDYPDISLKTLCWICHEKEHRDSVIPILDINGNLLNNAYSCQRCFGAGYLPQYNYHHGGICFRCDGKRIETNIF